MSLQPASSSGSPSEERRKSYKVGIDPEESRKRREKELVRIRKIHRRKTLNKKRRETDSSEELLKTLPEVVKRLCDEYPHQRLEATGHLRNMLTLGDSVPPIDELVKNGILPRFVEFLAMDDSPQLQIEALWVLSNFASATSQHKTVLVELGFVPPLINLLSSTDEDTREEVVWALGNIVVDSPNYRDLVLNHGALMPLLHQLQPNSSLYMQRVTTWCLSLLLRGEPAVNFEQVKPALPVLKQLVYTTDEEVLTDACWALANLLEQQIDKAEVIIELGVCPKLEELLQHPSNTVILPALQVFGNIAAGDVAQTQFVIDNQLLPCLRQLLMGEYSKSIFREVCWTIANITSGSKAQIQAVMDANFIPLLVEIIHYAEFEVKTEAAWAICNIASGGTHDNIRSLVAQGCIEALCALLTCSDLETVTICLEGLVDILGVGEADKDDTGNIFANRVEECGGWDKIEMLHTHANNEISTKAISLSDRFCPEVDWE